MRSFSSDDLPTVPKTQFNKVTYRCPYCGVLATITPHSVTNEHCICKCDNRKCEKMFYAKVKVIGKSECNTPYAGQYVSEIDLEILETYPKYVPQRHTSIPQSIWGDYLEACKCFDVEAFKSSVVMCRRTLQNVCLERGASKKDATGRYPKLRDQIKQAFPQKDYDLIQAFADKIKYFGDYGAHPQDDGIDNVTKEDARELLDFTYLILEIAYINLWRIKQLSGKKNAKT
jgi:hypothetical protein